MDPVDVGSDAEPKGTPDGKAEDTPAEVSPQDAAIEQPAEEPEAAPAAAAGESADAKDENGDEEATDRPDGDRSVRIDIRDNTMQGHGFEITGQKFEFFKERVDRLDPKDFLELSAKDLEGDDGGVRLDGQTLDDALDRLRARRILCISGEPEIGKGTFACHLAWRLACEKRSHGALVQRSITRHVSVRLSELVKRIAATGSAPQAIVIEDALSGANRDLMAWLAKLDEREVSSLTGKLEEAGYLLLTSDAELWAPFVDTLERLGLLVSLPAPDYSLLREVILQEVERVALGDSSLRQPAEQLLSDREDRIHSVLRTIPRARRFVRRYLLALLQDDGEADLDAALDRFDDAGSDLVSVLSDDLEAGCSLLALAVAQLEPGQDGVDWYDFDLLRCELSRRLRRRLNREEETLSATDLLSPYARELGIEFLRGGASDGDRVCFQDRLYGERIWRNFRTSGRGIAALLVPELLDLARSRDDRLRPLAARALGRLGQASPGSLTYRCADHWMGTEEEHLRDSLAQLMRGAAVAGDPGYLEGCLQRLVRNLYYSTDEDRALTFGRALREVGLVDVETAVEHLVVVLRRGSLHQKLDDMGKVTRQVRAVRDIMASEEIQRKAAIAAVLRETFGTAEGHLLTAVTYPLVGLCFGLGPPACLSALRPYLRDDDRAVARLLTLLHLSPSGLLDFLEGFTERLVFTDGKRSYSVSCLLAGVYSSERGAYQMTAVFEDLVTVAQDFPDPLCTYLRRRPLELVRKWCGKLEQVPEVGEDLGLLLHGLLHSRHEELREATFRMLQQEDPFVRSGTPLEALSHDVLTRPEPEDESGPMK